MRTYAISTLLLVLALVSGACAGRQARTRSIPAPPRAEITASVPAPEAEPSVADVAPVIETVAVPEPVPAAPVVKETPAMAGARLIAEHDAANRAASERKRGPEVSKNDAALVAALKVDAARVRRLDREVAKEFAAMWREFDAMIARLEADERAARKATRVAGRLPAAPTSAPAVEDEARTSVIGSVASPPGGEVKPPDTPSILPSPNGGPTVITADPMKDRPAPTIVPDLFLPDPNSVKESQAHWRKLLSGALLAGIAGILCGLLVVWNRNRRANAMAKNPYDRYPDGTVLMQEVVGGELVTREAFLPTQAPRSEPEAPEQAEDAMDAIEQTWHAEGDVADDAELEIEDEDDPQAGTPRNRRFDLTDEEPVVPQPKPVPFKEPDPIVAPEPSFPHVQSGSDVALITNGAAPVPEPLREPRSEPETIAAGSGRIVTSEHALTASGDTPIPAPPRESRSEPEPIEKVIVYEDESVSNPGLPPAATPN